MTYEIRRLVDLRPDPANREIFDPLEGRDFEELVESIREHGIINPLTVTPDGLIIAGEQRYRAALAAGRTEVLVTVRDVDAEGIERLRIEENIRRRVLKPSETARAIRRLFDLNDVKQGPRGDSATVAEIAKSIEMPERTARQYNTLADLIPSLSKLLDSGTLTQAIAVQLAQLSIEDQARIAERLAEVGDLWRRLAELEERERNRPDPIEQLRAEAQTLAERARMEARKEARSEAERELAARDREIENLKAAQKLEAIFKRDDLVHKFLQRAIFIHSMNATNYVNELGGLLALEPFLRNDLEIADALAGWLADYSRALRQRLGQSNGLRSIQ